jgi:hypothetical protein
MNPSLIAAVILLAAGLTAAAAFLLPGESGPSASPAAVEVPALNASVAIEDRVAALETAVSDEREARRVLEDELVALYAELDRLRTGAPAPKVAGTAEEPLPPPLPSRMREENTFEERSEALVDEGLSAERAAYIVQRESELRFAQMQAYYEARNAENPEERLAELRNPDEALRAEIGEAEYEKYLKANNRSTSVTVEGVMSSSPAADAGLQPGDEIVRYGGDRVFNSRDLIERSMEGDGFVVVELVRDGAAMEVVLPRGPLGIEIGRRRS